MRNEHPTCPECDFPLIKNPYTEISRCIRCGYEIEKQDVSKDEK
jgi:ribosomal protein L37AE/L43A